VDVRRSRLDDWLQQYAGSMDLIGIETVTAAIFFKNSESEGWVQG